MDIKNEFKNIQITSVGIGVFLFLTVSGFSYLFEISIKDLLLCLNVQPIIILWTKLLIKLTIFVTGFLLGINIIKSSKKSELIIFRNVIILFVLSQVLQFSEVTSQSLFITENYLKNSSKYYDLINTAPNHYLAVEAIGFLIFAIAGIIIYKKR